MKKNLNILLILISFFTLSVQSAPPTSFDEGKRLSRDYIYYNQEKASPGTLYCGCDWKWTTRTGGKVYLESCGYEVRKNKVRANRTEYEHVTPAWVFGHQRQCWQNGGRKNCTANDPIFNMMEGDLHNLTIAIGEVNADRSNFRFGMVNSKESMYGQCASKTDFKQRIFEPRDEVKGFVARVNFYMHDRYGLNMSRQQQQLFMAWDKMYPPESWELERDERIANVTGVHNPFVTRERAWSLGHKNSRSGLPNSVIKKSFTTESSNPTVKESLIVGNKRSKVYHLPEGCPSYDKVSKQNTVYFKTEAEAASGGYRKAGNCR